MTIDGDILEIELDLDIQGVLDLKNFIIERLEYIEEIKIVGEMKRFSSSSLFQLLHSIKKSKPTISISAIEGNLSLSDYGIMHWIEHD